MHDKRDPDVIEAWRRYSAAAKDLPPVEYQLFEPSHWAALQAALEQAKPVKGKAVKAHA